MGNSSRLVIALLLLTAAAPVLAQDAGADLGRGTWAAGIDVGAANPLGSSDFDASFVADVYFEWYQSRQLSWRAMVSYLAFDGPASGEDVGLLILNGNAVFRWPHKMVLPFVTAGLGLYQYDASGGSSKLELGFDFGGGVDFLLMGSSTARPRIAIKLEGLFHGTSGVEPDSFFQGSAGVRFLW